MYDSLYTKVKFEDIIIKHILGGFKMSETILSIKEDKFLINNKLVYSEIPDSLPQAHGLLMNARFFQGVFDDVNNRERYARFGATVFDPEKNTEDLIKALPMWYRYGLRAFTVGFQGGGPCCTINNYSINNNPYGENGTSIDKAYLSRMESLIKAADKLGMIVIVSCFYGAQTRHLKDDKAVINAVKQVSNWIKDLKFTNVIIEIANEHDIWDFKVHPVLYTEEGVVDLIKIAKKESGGVPVGCSGTGGYFSEIIAEASDIILIHGNGQTRQQYYNLIKKAKAIKPIKPILCNEDSQAISQLEVSFKAGVSWGYYNNMTKQEPPTYWSVLKGEDNFFAHRMAMGIGIKLEEMPKEEEFYLQGLEPNMIFENKRWVRLSSLYPEKINYVEFYRNEELIDIAYDDPFMVNYKHNWLQEAIESIEGSEKWKAIIYLLNGEIVKKEVLVK